MIKDGIRAIRSFIRDWWKSPPTYTLLPLLPLVLPSLVRGFVGTWQDRASSKAVARNKHYGAAVHPGNDSVLALSALELAAEIRAGNVKCSQVVDIYIQQLQRSNEALNCVAVQRYTQAKEEAAGYDKNLGDKPFAGVPIVVKECFEMKGLAFSGGVKSREHEIGTTENPIIQRLHRAGFIILATTNTSEACMFHESDNCVYGRTGNPYDIYRTAGGSSGGVGAAVSARGACVGLASDVGGSIRIPSLYCGLFGHKPSGGLVSNQNTFPVIKQGSDVDRYCQLGPIARTAHDLGPLLALITNNSIFFQPPSTKKTIVYYHPELFAGKSRLFSCGLHPEMRCALLRAVNALRPVCSEIRPLPQEFIPLASNPFELWSATLSTSGAQSFRDIIQSSHPLLETILGLMCGGKTARHTVPAAGLAFVEDFTEKSSRSTRFRARLKLLKQKLHALLSANDQDVVLLIPSLPTPAPFHNENLLRFISAGQTALFNVLELAVTAIPMGLSEASGLPLGVQVVAAADARAISIAVALEDLGVAKWTPPLFL